LTKAKSITHPLKCTLEDLYKGKSMKIKIKRKRTSPNDAEKVLECAILKGTPNGHKYFFKGEADEDATKDLKGDVTFIVETEKHKLFKRDGADLLITKTITLVESITGVEFGIKHLNGSSFKVASQEGEVIKPGQIMTLKNLGMPYFKDKTEKKFGNLFILFKV
jgi:DnaJ-class molecular chaperone|tara:strand:+ start:430 stop:921 length:492 start_codon:yes stop_codon:yes gene_type:complete